MSAPVPETAQRPGDLAGARVVVSGAAHGIGAATAERFVAAGAGGAIVDLASTAAETGGAIEGAHAASEAAVLALTRAAALERGGHGVRENDVCPGCVPTGTGAATRTDADVASWCSRSPLGRLGTPEDVAAAARFLASADAAYLTGQVIHVSGGMMLH